MRARHRKTHWQDLGPASRCSIEGWSVLIAQGRPPIAARTKQLMSYILDDFSWADNDELARRKLLFSATVSDYDATLNCCDWRVPHHMEAYLRASKNGHRLGYYLAKHPDLYALVIAEEPICAIARLLNLDYHLEWGVVGSVPPEVLYSAEYDTIPDAEGLRIATRLQQLFWWDPQSRRAS